MKKIYLLSFLMLVFCAGRSLAQAQKPITFGIKAGMNLADFNDPDGLLSNQDKTMLLAAHAGGFVTFLLSEKFSLQPEVLLSLQGAKYNSPNLLDPSTGEEIDLQVESSKDLFTYLNVPVMLQFLPSPGFRIEAGPQVGFLLNARAKVEAGDQSFEQDQPDYFKSVDFGLGLGLGYRLPLGLDFYGRYNLGLTNIFDEEVTGNSAMAIRNGAISIGVGYVF